MELLNDREEFKQRMRNLDAEEKKIAVNVIPNELLLEELTKRLTSATETVMQMRELLKVQETE